MCKINLENSNQNSISKNRFGYFEFRGELDFRGYFYFVGYFDFL